MIFDPGTGAVVADRWLGMRGTVAKLKQLMQRLPDHAERGYECWGRVTAHEAALIAEASYADGATPTDIAELARAFPDGEFWWMFTHDY
jgi:hypothetical protein